GPQDDAADGRRNGSAGRPAEEHQVRQRSQRQERAVRIRTRPHSAEDTGRASARNGRHAGRPAWWLRVARRRPSAATARHEDAGSEQAQTPQGVARPPGWRSVRYDDHSLSSRRRPSMTETPPSPLTPPAQPNDRAADAERIASGYESAGSALEMGAVLL